MPDSTQAPCAAHPESVNARLAAYLRANRGAISAEWMGRVLSDPAVGNETLTTAELKSSMPALFESLVSALCQYGNEDVAQRSSVDSAKHGAMRWQQGYNFGELLREIRHLRAVFIYHLARFEDAHPDFGMVARLFAATTVHAFLDDLLVSAAEEYVKADKSSAQQESRLPSSAD